MTPKEKGEDPPSASPSRQGSPAEQKRRRHLTVVVAEDNPTDVFLVEQALEAHNVDATLVCHRDGEEMLRYMEEVDRGTTPCPDVVLLDLNLPRHNGKAVLARIRGSMKCASVPVIVVTSSGAPEDRADAQRLGATRYFCKSIDYDEAMTLGALVLEVTRRNDAN